MRLSLLRILLTAARFDNRAAVTTGLPVTLELWIGVETGRSVARPGGAKTGLERRRSIEEVKERVLYYDSDSFYWYKLASRCEP